MHSRFDSWSNIHLLSIIEAFFSGAVRMFLVWISKAVISHIDEEAMSLSVYYNIVIAILLVIFSVSTYLPVVCHHFIHWWIPEGPRGPAPHPTPLSQGLHDCPSPYLKVWIGHCYLSDVAVSRPCCLSKFYPNMASLYTVFFARNIIIVMITIPTQQVYRVMVILASSTELFMLFSQMTCSHNTFALLPWSERLEHADITQSHCLSLSVKNKSIWSTFL